MSDKPDFEAIASKMYYDNHNEDTDHILQYAMNFVWSSHVEPLQKENEQLRESIAQAVKLQEGMSADIDRLITDKVLLQSEIASLKEEREFMKNILNKNISSLFMSDDARKTLGEILHPK